MLSARQPKIPPQRKIYMRSPSFRLESVRIFPETEAQAIPRISKLKKGTLVYQLEHLTGAGGCNLFQKVSHSFTNRYHDHEGYSPKGFFDNPIKMSIA
jgi:hypothetical protein